MKTLFSILLLATLSACTANKAYRNDLLPCSESNAEKIATRCADSAFQHYAGKDDYHLGFVEVDDQGQLHNPNQLSLIRDNLTEFANENGAIVVVFVHGWLHNAKGNKNTGKEDQNIEKFREVLSAVSRFESVVSRKRPVVGLYVGWRGKSIAVPGVRRLTFWDRKNVAHELGEGALTEILLSIESVLKTNDNNSSNSHLAVVGHSFGGAATYSAISQILVDRFAESGCLNGSNCKAKGFGDLVVLLNPAFEAMSHNSLYSISNNVESYSRDQLPLLAILTSEADWATKYAFYGGRLFSTFFERERAEEDQERKNRTAVGHYKGFLSHRLDPIDDVNGKTPPNQESEEALKANVEKFSANWSDPQYDFPDAKVSLTRLGNQKERNPYLSIIVDKELIPSHNNIYKPEILGFLRQLVLLSLLDK